MINRSLSDNRKKSRLLRVHVDSDSGFLSSCRPPTLQLSHNNE